MAGKGPAVMPRLIYRDSLLAAAATLLKIFTWVIVPFRAITITYRNQKQKMSINIHLGFSKYCKLHFSTPCTIQCVRLSRLSTAYCTCSPVGLVFQVHIPEHTVSSKLAPGFSITGK